MPFQINNRNKYTKTWPSREIMTDIKTGHKLNSIFLPVLAAA